jgi:hypothetical protein
MEKQRSTTLNTKDVESMMLLDIQALREVSAPDIPIILDYHGSRIKHSNIAYGSHMFETLLRKFEQQGIISCLKIITTPLLHPLHYTKTATFCVLPAFDKFYAASFGDVSNKYESSLYFDGDVMYEKFGEYKDRIRKYLNSYKNSTIIRCLVNNPNKVFTRKEIRMYMEEQKIEWNLLVDDIDRLDNIIQKSMPMRIYKLYFKCGSGSAMCQSPIVIFIK